MTGLFGDCNHSYQNDDDDHYYNDDYADNVDAKVFGNFGSNDNIKDKDENDEDDDDDDNDDDNDDDDDDNGNDDDKQCILMMTAMTTVMAMIRLQTGDNNECVL